MFLFHDFHVQKCPHDKSWKVNLQMACVLERNTWKEYGVEVIFTINVLIYGCVLINYIVGDSLPTIIDKKGSQN